MRRASVRAKCVRAYSVRVCIRACGVLRNCVCVRACVRTCVRAYDSRPSLRSSVGNICSCTFNKRIWWNVFHTFKNRITNMCPLVSSILPSNNSFLNSLCGARTKNSSIAFSAVWLYSYSLASQRRSRNESLQLDRYTSTKRYDDERRRLRRRRRRRHDGGRLDPDDANITTIRRRRQRHDKGTTTIAIAIIIIINRRSPHKSHWLTRCNAVLSKDDMLEPNCNWI